MTPIRVGTEELLEALGGDRDLLVISTLGTDKRDLCREAIEQATSAELKPIVVAPVAVGAVWAAIAPSATLFSPQYVALHDAEIKMGSLLICDQFNLPAASKTGAAVVRFAERSPRVITLASGPEVIKETRGARFLPHDQILIYEPS